MLPTRATVVLFLVGFLIHLAGLFYAVLRGLLIRTYPIQAEWLPGMGLVPALQGLALGFDGVVFLAFLLDGLLARRALGRSRLRVEREPPGRLSVGVEAIITLIVDNLGGRALQLRIRDIPPVIFPSEGDTQQLRIPSGQRLNLRYRITPTERGNAVFGDISVRVRGPLGLTWADRTVSARSSVPVLPNLLEVRRHEALVRATLVRQGGTRRQRTPGTSREFSHYRDYTPDDDYRNVSWKATARRGRPITAVHESELSQNILLCLDVGRMMAARVGALSKLDHAINAVLMLTHVSQSFQDNVGLLVFSHTVHLYLPPAKGKSQHAHFLQALYSVRPEPSYVNYREAFEYLIARHPKRALTMVFTDLLDSVISAEFRDAARLLKRFHLPLTLAVADVPLQTLAARTPQGIDDLYHVLVSREMLQGRAELLGGLEREGVLVLDTVPERLTTDAVNRYLELRGAKN